MLGLLNYEWHEITINGMSITLLELCMIWELKNEKRYDMNDERYLKRYEKWWHVHNASGVVLKDNEIVEVVGTSCIMCVHASREIHHPITRVRTRTSNGRTTIVTLYIALPWWLLVLMSPGIRGSQSMPTE